MAGQNDRFIRWQGNAMTQMSVALALFSTLSIGGLGLCFSLIQQASFKPAGCYATVFLVALLFLFVSSLSSITATVTRLIDFRITAQNIRQGIQEDPLTYFGTDSNGYGKATWRLFWASAALLFMAVILLSITISKVYLENLLNATFI